MVMSRKLNNYDYSIIPVKSDRLLETPTPGLCLCGKKIYQFRPCNSLQLQRCVLCGEENEVSVEANAGFIGVKRSGHN